MSLLAWIHTVMEKEGRGKRKKEEERMGGMKEGRKEGRKGGRQNIQTETKQITDFCTHAFVKGLIFKG